MVVIGAGVIGAAIAYRLARARAGPVLIDRDAPGRGTSANSFAWINSNDKPPPAYHRLNAESMAAHRRLRDDVASDRGPAATGGWLHEGGALEWTDTADGRARLFDKAARLREWGYRIEVIDAAEARRLEPYLHLDGLTAATFCPDEAWLDGPLFASQLAAAAKRFGAEVRTATEITGIVQDGERIAGVRLSTGETLAADVVVIAAGRWSGRVAAFAGVDVPLAPTCGLLAVTNPVDRGVSRVVHVPGMNFRPEAGGGLVLQSGATDATVTADTPPSPVLPGCAELLRRVQRFLPSVAQARIVEGRVGVRPMPADGLSIVGPVQERPGLYLCVTHSGVTLSALFGELAASEVTTGQPDARLSDFRPARCVSIRG